MSDDKLYLIYYFPPIIKLSKLSKLDKEIQIALLDYVDTYKIKRNNKEEEIQAILLHYGVPIKKNEKLTTNQWKARLLRFYLQFVPYAKRVWILLEPRGETITLLDEVEKTKVDLEYLSHIRKIMQMSTEANKYYSTHLQKTSFRELLITAFEGMTQNPRKLIFFILFIFMFAMLLFFAFSLHRAMNQALLIAFPNNNATQVINNLTNIIPQS